MKTLFTLIFALLSINSNAASTTAYPFSFDIFTEDDSLKVSAQLLQSCRYEKFVIGDSAEFETEYKRHKLNVLEGKSRGVVKHTISLDFKKVMNLDGMFKYGKECNSMLEVTISDKLYSIGWASRFDTPISFKLDTGFYNYKEGDSEFNAAAVTSILEDNVVSFNYVKVGSIQYNIFFFVNGERNFQVSPKTAAQNSETGLPYRLQ